jgi:dihydropteroate synthase
VDTRKGEVAKEALAAGADMINNVGGFDDQALFKSVAASDVPLVIMHSRGELASMQRDIAYGDPLTEIRQELDDMVQRAVQAGISRDQLIIDPGIGFGKALTHNLLLLRELGTLQDLELPILVGASRKSFIGQLTGEPPAERLPGSLAAAAWATYHGAAMIRVHDVQETVRFLRVYQAIDQAQGGTAA